jgi:hypothetical protein
VAIPADVAACADVAVPADVASTRFVLMWQSMCAQCADVVLFVHAAICARSSGAACAASWVFSAR